jgi:hypothetical protein
VDSAADKRHLRIGCDADCVSHGVTGHEKAVFRVIKLRICQRRTPRVGRWDLSRLGMLVLGLNVQTLVAILSAAYPSRTHMIEGPVGFHDIDGLALTKGGIPLR